MHIRADAIHQRSSHQSGTGIPDQPTPPIPRRPQYHPTRTAPPISTRPFPFAPIHSLARQYRITGTSCSDFAGQMQFQLFAAAKDKPQTQTTGDRSPAAVIFDNLAADDYTLLGTVPGGYILDTVFCTLYDGTTQSDYGTIDNAADGVAQSLDGVDAYSCDWFLVEAGSAVANTGSDSSNSAGTPEASPVAPISDDLSGPAEFDASFSACAEIPSSDTVDDFWNSCDPITDTVTVTLSTSGADQTLTQTTGDLADSAVIFDGIAAATWTATTKVPNGFDGATVFCARYDGSNQGPYEQMPSDSATAFAFSLGEQDALSCEWFLTPPAHQTLAGDTGQDSGTTEPIGTVIDDIQTAQFKSLVFGCPSMPDGATKDQLEGACKLYGGNLTFTAAEPDNGHNTDRDNGQAGWRQRELRRPFTRHMDRDRSKTGRNEIRVGFLLTRRWHDLRPV